MSSISSTLPIAAYMPLAVAPAQSTSPQTATTANGGNNITLNAYNAVSLGSDISNLLVANELDVRVDGSNNNITVNEYNFFSGGSQLSSPSILPSQNADGTINLTGDAQSTIDNYISQELQALISGTKSYNQTNQNNNDTSTPTTDILA